MWEGPRRAHWRDFAHSQRGAESLWSAGSFRRGRVGNAWKVRLLLQLLLQTCETRFPRRHLARSGPTLHSLHARKIKLSIFCRNIAQIRMWVTLPCYSSVMHVIMIATCCPCIDHSESLPRRPYFLFLETQWTFMCEIHFQWTRHSGGHVVLLYECYSYLTNFPIGGTLYDTSGWADGHL